LSKKNLKKQCTKTVEQIDQDEIIIAYSKGLLTEDEIESMFPKKFTYAFLVK
jgi:predicted RNA-binding protein associated with RNAse of E/G family